MSEYPIMEGSVRTFVDFDAYEFRQVIWSAPLRYWKVFVKTGRFAQLDTALSV